MQQAHPLTWVYLTLVAIGFVAFVATPFVN
jgi:hypothetical protein